MPKSVLKLRPRVAVALLFSLFLTSVLFRGFPAGAAETVTLPSQTIAPGQVQLTVKLVLPPGHKLNAEAPSTLILTSQDQNVLKVDKKFAGNLTAANLPLKLQVPAKPGQTTLQAEFKINFCDDKVGLCFMRDATVQLPVQVSKDAKNKTLELLYELKMP